MSLTAQVGEPLERRELLARFRAGERAALEAVYRHHVGEVAQFLRRGFNISGREGWFRFSGYHQPFDLDNAVQETFARAFADAARLGFDGLRPFKSYLCGIARNLVIDEFRSRRSALEPFGELSMSQGQSQVEGENGQQSVEDELLAQELALLYRRFVDELDDRDRKFFISRFEQQKTQIEAGRDCGLSHMQSRTLEKKLRARLLEHMRTQGYLETEDCPRPLLTAPALE
jgi:RNA polymerase sigma factor (sigma-70 family)